jgi:flagellar biosynthetic protein FlhB
MADNSSDEEKTEDPTPRRLEKAREEGQVARSRELSTFLMLLGGVIGLWTMGGMLYDQLGLVMEQSFIFDRGITFDTARMMSSVWVLGSNTLFALIP